MKYSLRVVVIILPVVVAISCAWWGHSLRTRQAAELEHYLYCLENGRSVSPINLWKDFGRFKCQELFAEYSNVTSDVLFDGTDRWVQIVHVPNAPQVDTGDGYNLFSLAHGHSSWHWPLPKGAEVERVYFEGDELVFLIHGKIEMGSYAFDIAEAEPAEYRLLWKSGTAPPEQSIWALMSQDYCVPKNHVP